MIKAAAVVEDAAERAWLPRVPGTAEQRDWDPEIPLFLDDVDEHGKVPVSHYLQRERGEGGGGPPFTEPSASSSNGRSATMSYSARMGLVQQSRMDRKFEKAGVSGKHQATNTNQPGGESLEPITMFASYDPAAFISEPIPRINSDRRPIWSRRRWVMSNEFLVPKSAKPKNTIKDQ
jgi:hypothetical protein